MMAEESIPFVIKSITTNEFATIKGVYEQDAAIDVSTGFGFAVDMDSNAISSQLDLVFKCEEAPFIILKVLMQFEVPQVSFDKFVGDGRRTIVVPKGFATHLAAMTVSTARGVLHCKLDNTEFDFLLLPALNVSEILDSDLQFEI